MVKAGGGRWQPPILQALAPVFGPPSKSTSHFGREPRRSRRRVHVYALHLESLLLEHHQFLTKLSTPAPGSPRSLAVTPWP
jgi:hypothetical protein